MRVRISASVVFLLPFALVVACTDDATTAVESESDSGGTAEESTTVDSNSEDTGDETTTESTGDETATDESGSDDTESEETGDGRLCGDGILDGDEACDDGNSVNEDDCTDLCEPAVCGDGYVHAEVEQCDSGPANGPGNACTTECLINVCGDGLLGPREACDDGNAVDDDSCTNACALASCGDGLLNGAELCDDGNLDNTDGCSNTCLVGPEMPLLALEFSAIKQFEFGWDPAAGAEFYQLFESVDGVAEYELLDANIVGTAASVTMPLHLRFGARYVLRACSVQACTDSAAVEVVDSMVTAIGYFKSHASNLVDKFGDDLAISADGSTMVVSSGEASGATGIDGDATDNSAPTSGAAYVFVRNPDDEGWAQQAFLKASNTNAADFFGTSLAISADGDTIVIGASGEDSGATGVDGDQADNSADRAGAAYVFVRDDQEQWSQEAYLKPVETDVLDLFGTSVAISASGDRVAVGARGDDGLPGDPASDAAEDSGAVHVFGREGQVWTQEAYIKGPLDADDGFAAELGIDGPGETLVVGARLEDSSATGVNGDQFDTSASAAGAAFVFTRDDQGEWLQQAYLKASNTEAQDRFGYRVEISQDGATVAISAQEERSCANGIDGDQTDNLCTDAGAVYVFSREGQEWSQQAYVKSSNSEIGEFFHWCVALSANGDVLAVGARGNYGGSSGVAATQPVGASLSNSGAVYVFVRDELDQWSQRGYVKASNTDKEDYFGGACDLSGDGATLGVGATGEDSNALGIGGNASDDSLGFSGAVYLY